MLRRMHINHESPAFTTNGCKWVQDQPDLYTQIPKVGWIGLDRAFYRLFSEKSTQKTLFLLQATCNMHVYRPAIFLHIYEHNILQIKIKNLDISQRDRLKKDVK